jgi:hypothetical protein
LRNDWTTSFASSIVYSEQRGKGIKFQKKKKKKEHEPTQVNTCRFALDNDHKIEKHAEMKHQRRKSLGALGTRAPQKLRLRPRLHVFKAGM